MATVAEVIATPITEEDVKVVPEAAPEPAAEVRTEEEPSPRAEKKEKEKEEKPRSLAAFKVLTSFFIASHVLSLFRNDKNTVRSVVILDLLIR